MDSDSKFSVQYTHSIHRTPIIEKYSIDDNMNIVLDEVVFESYGVGVSSDLEPGQTFTEENGKFIIGNMNRRFPFFDQRIAQMVGTHILKVNNREISLADLSPPGSWLRFQAAKETAWQRVERRLSKWEIIINPNR
ncbi:DUF1850 domain-containing protein [Effusibacillus consociatus]|uniref:DUF1850 domain-containing protein n=1 Tax=Effusibacillus consociatus TaxID=1117041 RepID=A0ABV9PZI4_9BACL